MFVLGQEVVRHIETLTSTLKAKNLISSLGLPGAISTITLLPKYIDYCCSTAFDICGRIKTRSIWIEGNIMVVTHE